MYAVLWFERSSLPIIPHFKIWKPDIKTEDEARKEVLKLKNYLIDKMKWYKTLGFKIYISQFDIDLEKHIVNDIFPPLTPKNLHEWEEEKVLL